MTMQEPHWEAGFLRSDPSTRSYFPDSQEPNKRGELVAQEMWAGPTLVGQLDSA